MLSDLIYSKEDSLKYSRLKQLIGQGRYGSVYEAVYIEAEEAVAVKIMFIDVTEIEILRKEILVMKECTSWYKPSSMNRI